jgi:hypothetical protein
VSGISFRLVRLTKDNIKVNCQSVQTSFPGTKTSLFIKQLNSVHLHSDILFSATHFLFELENLSPRGINLPAGGNDLSPRGNKLPVRGNDLSPRGNNLSVRGNDLSAGGINLSPRGINLPVRGNDLSPRGINLSPRGNDIPILFNNLFTTL